MFADLPRIISDPQILGGKPIVSGTRISVEFLLELFDSGATDAQILKSYSSLSPEDLRQALAFASRIRANQPPTSGQSH